MTRYDDVVMDPKSGLTTHPLAGVSQAALDAATKALVEATDEQIIGADDQRERVFDSDQVESVAHAVLLAALQAGIEPEPENPYHPGRECVLDDLGQCTVSR